MRPMHILSAIASAVAVTIAAAQDIECPRLNGDKWHVAPCFRDSVPAEYPHMAYLARVEGTVCVAVTILASGVPCRVVPVSGPVPLHVAAIRAAESSRYVPASKAGIAVPSIKEVCYTFRLGDPIPERPDWPLPDLRHPRVSDVVAGQRLTTAGGVEYTEYRYADVAIRGDLSVALCDSVLSLIGAKLKTGQQIVRITHYLALPRNWDPDYQLKWRAMGDLTVDVQQVPNGGTPVRKQQTYMFFGRNGRYELSPVVSMLCY